MPKIRLCLALCILCMTGYASSEDSVVIYQFHALFEVDRIMKPGQPYALKQFCDPTADTLVIGKVMWPKVRIDSTFYGEQQMLIHNDTLKEVDLLTASDSSTAALRAQCMKEFGPPADSLITNISTTYLWPNESFNAGQVNRILEISYDLRKGYYRSRFK